VAGLWFSPRSPVSSINKADRYDIAEILLKVDLNTITSSIPLTSLSIIDEMSIRLSKQPQST